ncbi:hypothetical protein D0C36_08205 [Mucilaginibacter conchicola]|uniref:Uncharacterized protein n=1 Tax=Mucilaginibacter conchicola TaxID=2303333 RepID=A0A372NZE2_9SPHI|nr:hypothetical protein [Mucilaginibacter conchicola]RFZ95490.1 hypothetical protein D0C36_08205 [Mucilaginibacter conchicola]
MENDEARTQNSIFRVPSKGGIGLTLILGVFAIIGLWLLSAPMIMIIILAIVIIIFLRVHAIKEYTYSISLDLPQKQLMLITKSRTSSQTEYFSFNDLWFIYKKRADYFGTKSRVTPQKKDILLIDSKRKTLAFLVPEQDGWTQKLIFDLAKEMAASGIEQKIDKYDKNEIVVTTSSL